REQIFARAINANYRLGRVEDFNRLLRFIGESGPSTKSRANALNAIADWEQPAPRDRVVGLWRPLENRNAKADRAALVPVLRQALKENEQEIIFAAQRCVQNLEIKELSPALFALL